MVQICIACSYSDKGFAQELAHDIQNLGTNSWPTKKIVFLRDNPRKIQQNLDDSDVLLVVISPNAMNSDTVEFSSRYYHNSNKPMLLLLREKAQVNTWLRENYAFIDFSGNHKGDALRQLEMELHKILFLNSPGRARDVTEVVIEAKTKKLAELTLLNEGMLRTNDGITGKNVFLVNLQTHFGRDGEDVHITLEGFRLVSRFHCTIAFIPENNAFYLIDRASMNGTKLNNVKLEAESPVNLQDNALIELGVAGEGGAILRFRTNLTPLSKEIPAEIEIDQPKGLRLGATYSPHTTKLKQPELFISYSHDDHAIMQRVRQRLIQALPHVQIWTDEHLKPGEDSWQKAITHHIDIADGVIAIMSPNAKQSIWVEREINYASSRSTTIYPILAAGTGANAVPLSLSGTQNVDIRSDFEKEIQKLIAAIRENIKRSK